MHKMRLCSIRNLNNQLKKLEILSNLKRSHSTSPSSSSSLVSTIPRNLQIQDMSVLDTPPVPKIERMDYLFPTKNVPKTIDVYPFFSSSSKLNSTEGTIDPIEQESDIDVAPLPVSISSVPLDARIFGVAIRKDIVHECVRYMRHKRRQPHKTKRMSEIRGSNKKPWQQKGLGRAQFGHKRNSVWRGGQKAHGPVLRDFDIGLNKKMRAMGMMIAIAAKQREGNLIVVDNFDCTSFKTKYVYWALRRFQIHEKKTLMVDVKLKKNFFIASQNLPLVESLSQLRMNVFNVIKCDRMVITAPALALLQQRLWKQYTHRGKKQAYANKLDAYLNAVATTNATTNATNSATKSATAAN